MKELETIQRVIEALSRGAEAVEAIADFCEWLFHDPAEPTVGSLSITRSLLLGPPGPLRVPSLRPGGHPSRRATTLRRR